MEKELTISNAPLRTPQSTLLNHNPPSNTSSGSSTNSARGFSSSANVKYEPAVACEIDGLLVGRGDDGGGGPL